MRKKLFTLILAIVLCMSSSMTAFASENDNVPFQTYDAGIIGEQNLLAAASFDNVYQTDHMSDKIGYYDYSLKINFNKSAAGKFTDCLGYIYTHMNTLAVLNPNFVVTCSISNATHSISSDGTKITINFDMNYAYSPSFYGSGWTEHVTYVLYNYEV